LTKWLAPPTRAGDLTCSRDTSCSESLLSVTSDIGPVVSEVILVFVGGATLNSAIRIWREKPQDENSSGAHVDRRPRWFVVGAMPTAMCVVSLAIAFPLSYGLQSKTSFFANFCYVVGGLCFAFAAICALILMVEVFLLFFERPVPRFLTPPSRRNDPRPQN
jgi:hypothetical protein